jgi:hypothetical protein
MHEKGERKASEGLLLASCMDDVMVELVELGSGSAQARARRKVKRRPQGEWEEQGDAHLVVRRRSSPARVYGIREASEARADK